MRSRGHDRRGALPSISSTGPPSRHSPSATCRHQDDLGLEGAEDRLGAVQAEDDSGGLLGDRGRGAGVRGHGGGGRHVAVADVLGQRARDQLVDAVSVSMTAEDRSADADPARAPQLLRRDDGLSPQGVLDSARRGGTDAAGAYPSQQRSFIAQTSHYGRRRQRHGLGAVAATAGATAAAGPPLPKATNGKTVHVVATGLGTPTAFAFGNGIVYEGDGGVQGANGPTAPGGVFALKAGKATRLAGSPDFVGGVAFSKGTLYVTAAYADAKSTCRSSSRSSPGAAGTGRRSSTRRRSTRPRRASRASTASPSARTAACTWASTCR